MQNKYLEQIFDLYEHCHIVTMPLLDAEVGLGSATQFRRQSGGAFVPGTCQEYRDSKMGREVKNMRRAGFRGGRMVGAVCVSLGGHRSGGGGTAVRGPRQGHGASSALAVLPSASDAC